MVSEACKETDILVCGGDGNSCKIAILGGTPKVMRDGVMVTIPGLEEEKCLVVMGYTL